MPWTMAASADALVLLDEPTTRLRPAVAPRASTVLTSNQGFEEWGNVLGDEVMVAALIDRLPDHCDIVNNGGNSYQHWLRSPTEKRCEGVAG